MACKAVLWFFGPHTKGRNGQTGSSPSDSLVVPSASFGCPPRVAAFVYSSGADKVRWPSVLLHLHALYMGPCGSDSDPYAKDSTRGECISQFCPDGI